VAGYAIYSLDWDKFQSFVNDPTDKQLLLLAKRVSEELLYGYDGDFEKGDPVQDWPTEPEQLHGLVKRRVARRDWYGDLSEAGKEVWSQAVWGFCCMENRAGVGFRAEHQIYFDLLEIAWKLLKVPDDKIHPDVALSAFGRRPYRYRLARRTSQQRTKTAFDAWLPMHSMHAPEEVRKMLKELRSIAPAIESANKKDVINDYDALLSVLEKLDKKGRMLFIQIT